RRGDRTDSRHAPRQPLSLFYRVPTTFLPPRTKRVAEDVVGHAASLSDAGGLVELPVDAEVDPALAVLLFGLRERREPPRQERPQHAVAAARDAVQLVRHEGEGNVVGLVKVAERFEECPAEARVSGRISRKRRREVAAVLVAGGRTERRERGVALG